MDGEALLPKKRLSVHNLISHNSFPEYIHARCRVPVSWTYSILRRFHQPRLIRHGIDPNDRGCPDNTRL